MFNGRRQPSCDGTSRMTRECQVRICERLGVQFPGPTRRPACSIEVAEMAAYGALPTTEVGELPWESSRPPLASLRLPPSARKPRFDIWRRHAAGNALLSPFS